MRVPPLETERLLIREFELDDLPAAHQLLDIDLRDTDSGNPAGSLAERQRWIEWTVLGYEQLANLHQPPYGDRAIIWKASGELTGTCGLVPCLDRYDRIPAMRLSPEQPGRGGCVAEVGLYWAISPAHQRQGFATEAARALVAHAFGVLNLERIIATTEHTNLASMAVMRKLGMRVDRNPDPDPPWLQVVGVLERATAAFVRALESGDHTEHVRMRHALWPDADVADLAVESAAMLTDPDQVVFVAPRTSGGLSGFVEARVRAFANGVDEAPCAFVEGWWVDTDARQGGIGRALIAAVERWAVGRGFHELGSDAELDNVVSYRAHQSLGFEERERVVYFRKQL